MCRGTPPTPSGLDGPLLLALLLELAWLRLALLLGLARLSWAIHCKFAWGLVIPSGILAVLSGLMIYSLIGPHTKIKKK